MASDLYFAPETTFVTTNAVHDVRNVTEMDLEVLLHETNRSSDIQRKMKKTSLPLLRSQQRQLLIEVSSASDKGSGSQPFLTGGPLEGMRGHNIIFKRTSADTIQKRPKTT